MWFGEDEPAVKRARGLLESWLTPDQLAQLKELGYFEVVGSDTGKKYRINNAVNYNIDELEEIDGEVLRVTCRYCVIPDISVPIWDRMLAQKMWLEKDEEATLAIANAIPVGGNNWHYCA